MPLLFQAFGRNKLVNGVHDLSTEVGDGFADIIGSQQTVTLGVDHLALIVSHIILFELVLTNIEVETFDFVPGFFDGVGPCDALSHNRRLISVMFFLPVCCLISETKPLPEKSQSKIGGE